MNQKVSTAYITLSGHVLKIIWSDALSRYSRVLLNFPSMQSNDHFVVVKFVPHSNVILQGNVKDRALTIGLPPTPCSNNSNSLDFKTIEIGVLQGVSRFIDLINKMHSSSIFLFHGTTIKTNRGLGIGIFDDGTCLGKTSLAAVLAQKGGTLIADEFSFVDTESLIAMGGPQWPIHVRSDVAKVLFPEFSCSEDIHILPKSLNLGADNESTLEVILFPRIGKDFGYRKLSSADLAKRLSRACTDHLRKFCIPGADRVSMLGSQVACLDIDANYLLDNATHQEDFLKNWDLIQSFEVTLGAPSELPNAAKSIMKLLSALENESHKVK